MANQENVHLYDIAIFLSEVLDFINSRLVNHHKLVAYIGACLAEELGFPQEAQNRVVLAGLLHDIGALSLSDRLDAMAFELDQPHQHAEMGALFLELFEPFHPVTDVVRHHHAPWNNGESAGEAVDEAHVVHLADRIAVLINPRQEILGQTGDILSRIRMHANTLFAPHLVGAFEFLAARESFWFSLTQPLINASLERCAQRLPQVAMDAAALGDLARLFCRLIDFRSRFTATHSSGVAASASLLAHYTGMSASEARLMEVAGYFHDIGKLSIPLEILEKPGKLTKQEFNVIKSHAYYTYYLLDRIPVLSTVRDWAALHHERLNGRGYPFHYTLDNIPLGSRIMAVADVFVAMAEDRPFRKAMKMSQALWHIGGMVDERSLDGDVVAVLKSHILEINDVRETAQREAAESYVNFGLHLRQAV